MCIKRRACRTLNIPVALSLNEEAAATNSGPGIVVKKSRIRQNIPAILMKEFAYAIG